MATMCQNHPDVKATFVGTVLEPDVVNVAVCDECMPLFCAAVFEEMTGVDMSPALYLASEEGQANPEGPPQPEPNNGQVTGNPSGPELGDTQGDPEQTAALAEAEAAAAGGEPPAPGPADEDDEAGWDFTRPPRETGPTPSGSAGPGTAAGPAGSGHAPPSDPATETTSS